MDNGQNSSNRKTPVLSDHQKIRKRLIPPLMQGINYKEISWRKQLIPELIWLALINNRYGHIEGAELALALPQSVEEATKNHQMEAWFVTVSSYTQLSIEEQRKIVELLRSKNVLDKYRTALLPLIYFYPFCPLRFLFNPETIKEDDTGGLVEIKRVLESIFDRRSIEATFIQANALYIGFNLGKLVVSQDVSLARFPEVQYYPHTEISKQIAANIRAMVNTVFDIDEIKNDLSWPAYFWNHGLELEKCILD
ncbi:MAG: hypothetical protein RBR35_16325 [Salinivirgaceae bacterium]|nr:hypothetical protein [Salinivirgaceae bacterium]